MFIDSQNKNKQIKKGSTFLSKTMITSRRTLHIKLNFIFAKTDQTIERYFNILQAKNYNKIM